MPGSISRLDSLLGYFGTGTPFFEKIRFLFSPPYLILSVRSLLTLLISEVDSYYALILEFISPELLPLVNGCSMLKHHESQTVGSKTKKGFHQLLPSQI